MSRKITVEVRVKLVIRADEGVEVDELMSEMDYNFTDQTGKATVEDTEILEHEITDSK